MPSVTVGRGGIDTSDLRKFARSLRRQEPKIALNMRLGLHEAGNRVRDQARTNVEEFSKTVPPTIRVRVSGVSVSVLSGNAKTPLAGLLELGNKGKNGNSSTFRAPNFPPKGSHGSEAFVRGGHDQKMHPYLAKALEAKTEEAVAIIVDVLDRAVKEAANL